MIDEMWAGFQIRTLLATGALKFQMFTVNMQTCNLGYLISISLAQTVL